MADWRSELDRLHLKATETRRKRVDEGWSDAVRRARSIARSALVVDLLGLSIDEIHDASLGSLRSDIPDDVRQALDRVGFDADIDPAAVAAYPRRSLEGLVNAVKGALFEQQVINGVGGGRLGEVVLPDGVTARLADFTEPGVDVELVDPDGDVVDVVQLKASDNADIIARHLQQYPEISHVWTTHEAAARAAGRGIEVLDTGISDTALSEHVRDALEGSESMSFTDVVDDLIPQVTLVMIFVGWIRARISGVDPADADADAVARVKRALLASSLAGAAAQVLGDGIRLPVVLTIRLVGCRGRLAQHSARRVTALGEVIDELKPAMRV